MSNPWVSAWKNPVSGVKAYSRCLLLSDLNDDGDFRFLIATDNKKLIIYHGVNMELTITLPDVPIAMTHVYQEVR